MTLVEVLVAVFLGALFIVAAVSLIAPALRVNTNAQNAQIVGALQKELADNVRAWAGGNWQNVFALSTSSASQYYLNTSVSPFTVASGAETVTIGTSTYQRYFQVSDAYRDASGNLTSTASQTYDPSTKQITVTSKAVTYDGTLGSWTQTTATPNASQGDPAVFYNGYIIQLESNAGTYYAQPSATGSIANWSSTTALPQGLSNYRSVAYNGYLYESGGGVDAHSNQPTTTVRYAPINATGSIGSWTQTTALPVPLSAHSMVTYNGYIYVLGGFVSLSTATATVYYAKPNANGTIGSWTQTAELPGLSNGVSGDAAAVSNGTIYQLDSINCCATYYAKPNADGSITSWSTTIGEPGDNANENALDADNGYLFKIGGLDASSNPTSTVYTTKPNADGSISSWGFTSKVPNGVAGEASVVNGDYIFAMGGAVPGGTTTTVNFAKMNSTPGPAQTTSFYLTRNGNNALDQTDWSGGATIAGTGAWANTTALPSPIAQYGAVAYNGYLYTTGGVQASTITSTVQYAPINGNGTIGSWSTTTALPSAIKLHSTVVYGGYIYTVGGIDKNVLVTSTVQYAPINGNGTIGSWSTTTALPKVMDYVSAVAYNGYLYTIGGTPIGGATSTVQSAPINGNGTIGSWSTTTALPGALYKESAVAYNNYLFTTGGEDKNSWATSTVQYAPINGNGTIGSWSTTTALPSVLYDLPPVVYNGYLYTTGGADVNGSPTSTVQSAPINGNGTIGSWSTTTALPGALDAPFTVVYNGYLETTGGWTGSVTTSTVSYSKLGDALTITAPNSKFSTSTNINATGTAGQISLSQVPVGGRVVNTDGWTCNSSCASHTLAHAASAGNLVVVVCNGFVGGASCGGSISASNPAYTWTCPDTGNNLSVCYIAPGTNTGGVTAITVNSVGSALIQEMEVSNIVTSSPVDVQLLSAEDGGSTWSSGGFEGTNLTGYRNVAATGTYSASGTMPNGSTDGYADIFGFKASSTAAVVNTDGWTCNSSCASHTLAHAASSGNLVVVVCNGFVGGASCGGSISASNPAYTWTCPDTGNNLSVCYIAPGTNTGGVTAITVNSVGSALIQEMEVSNIVTSSPVDVQLLGTENNGSTWTSGSITTHNAKEFVLAAVVSNVSASGMSINSPFASASIASTSLSATGVGDFLFVTTVSNVSSSGMSINSPFASALITQGSTLAGTNLIGYENITSLASSSVASGNMPSGSTDGYTDLIGFTISSSQYVSSGTLDSTTFDTGVAGGVQLNSVLWQGTQNGGQVQFQLAVSNTSTGPFSFIGSDGTGNTYYTPTGPNVSKQLDYSLFNNYRYFKVRTFLKSNTAQTQSPIVNDVVVNWSP